MFGPRAQSLDRAQNTLCLSGVDPFFVYISFLIFLLRLIKQHILTSHHASLNSSAASKLLITLIRKMLTLTYTHGDHKIINEDHLAICYGFFKHSNFIILFINFHLIIF